MTLEQQMIEAFGNTITRIDYENGRAVTFDRVPEIVTSKAMPAVVTQITYRERKPQPKAKTPPTHLVRPYKSLRAAIMTLQAPAAEKPPVKDYADVNADKIYTMAQIMRAVLKVTQVSLEDITGPSKNYRLTKLRQVFYYLARCHTYQSYPAIGRYCNRDHTTVLSGFRRIAAQYNNYQKLIAAVRASLSICEVGGQ